MILAGGAVAATACASGGQATDRGGPDASTGTDTPAGSFAFPDGSRADTSAARRDPGACCDDLDANSCCFYYRCDVDASLFEQCMADLACEADGGAWAGDSCVVTRNDFCCNADPDPCCQELYCNASPTPSCDPARACITEGGTRDPGPDGGGWGCSLPSDAGDANDGGAGCISGCSRGTIGCTASDPTVGWICDGPGIDSGDRFVEGGCTSLPINSVAWCCPSAFLSQCGCTPGQDWTCNDDPTASSLHGTCRPDGTCSCSFGSLMNRATGKCS